MFRTFGGLGCRGIALYWSGTGQPAPLWGAGCRQPAPSLGGWLPPRSSTSPPAGCLIPGLIITKFCYNQAGGLDLGLGKPGCEEIFHIFDPDPGPQPLASARQVTARQPARSAFMGGPGGGTPRDAGGIYPPSVPLCWNPFCIPADCHKVTERHFVFWGPFSDTAFPGYKSSLLEPILYGVMFSLPSHLEPIL